MRRHVKEGWLLWSELQESRVVVEAYLGRQTRR